jgi:hypothetical protein
MKAGESLLKDRLDRDWPDGLARSTEIVVDFIADSSFPFTRATLAHRCRLSRQEESIPSLAPDGWLRHPHGEASSVRCHS